MPDIIWKTHDTYPPWVTALSQNGSLLDLSSATSIKILLKGTSTVVTDAVTKLTVVTPTANTVLGSNVLLSVSSFTNIVLGGTITGAGIPPGARVSVFDSVAGTITMTDNQGNALNALATASTVTLQINKGCVQYTPLSTDLVVVDNWNFEHEITWSAGQVQTVPSGSLTNEYNTAQTIQDLG